MKRFRQSCSSILRRFPLRTLRILGVLCGHALPYPGKVQMTQLEVAYRYHTPVREATMRALDNLR